MFAGADWGNILCNRVQTRFLVVLGAGSAEPEVPDGEESLSSAALTGSSPLGTRAPSLCEYELVYVPERVRNNGFAVWQLRLLFLCIGCC